MATTRWQSVAKTIGDFFRSFDGGEYRDLRVRDGTHSIWIETAVANAKGSVLERMSIPQKPDSIQVEKDRLVLIRQVIESNSRLMSLPWGPELQEAAHEACFWTQVMSCYAQLFC